MSDGQAFNVFALHGVVQRLAIRLHSLFSEECLYNDFHVFSRSSRNTYSSLSIPVSGAHPYLCFDPV